MSFDYYNGSIKWTKKIIIRLLQTFNGLLVLFFNFFFQFVLFLDKCSVVECKN